MANSTKMRPVTWVWVSTGCFVLFIILAILLAGYGKRLELTVPVYFFLLVMIALMATGFLAGALRSQASYRGRVSQGNLYLAGPVVIFIIIIYLGYRFRPQPEEGPLTLTVNVYGPAGRSETIDKGKIKVQFENENRIEDITDKGQAVFGQLNASLRGSQIHIIPLADGYYFPNGDTLITLSRESGNVIDLQLRKKEHITKVHGLLVDATGNALARALISFPAFSQSVHTDSLGIFSIDLPVEEGEETEIAVYNNNKLKYRNKITISPSLTIPINSQ